MTLAFTQCGCLVGQVHIPELDLEVSTGTLGGLITTVEGLVDTIITTLKSTQVRRKALDSLACASYILLQVPFHA